MAIPAFMQRSWSRAPIHVRFVDPRHRKHGIGRCLAEVAIRQHGESPSSAPLHIVASPDAKAFYLACGFKIAGGTDTRFGPAIAMRPDPQAAGGLPNVMVPRQRRETRKPERSRWRYFMGRPCVLFSRRNQNPLRGGIFSPPRDRYRDRAPGLRTDRHDCH